MLIYFRLGSLIITLNRELSTISTIIKRSLKLGVR
jgi:hypothetical protein